MAPPPANGRADANKSTTRAVTTDIFPTSSRSDNDTESQDSLNGYANGDMKKSRFTRFRKHMAQDVHEDWADIILIVLSFISGMVDSAVFNTWSCFVSMQTGKSSRLLPPQQSTSVYGQFAKVTVEKATRSTLASACPASRTRSHTDGPSPARPSRPSASAATSSRA